MRYLVEHPAPQLLLVVQRSRHKTSGDRAFSVAAPRLWKTLRLHIMAAQSLEAIK